MRIQNNAYLKYIRDHSSCLWGSPEDWIFNGSYDHDPTVAHHCHLFHDGGIGTKPSDYKTVPLTATEHVQLHNGGEKAFWEAHGVDPKRVIAWLLSQYVKDKSQVLTMHCEVLIDQNLDLLIQRLEWQIEEERGPTKEKSKTQDRGR